MSVKQQGCMKCGRTTILEWTRNRKRRAAEHGVDVWLGGGVHGFDCCCSLGARGEGVPVAQANPLHTPHLSALLSAP